MIFDKSQLMRGTLEGCILKIISKKVTYGYEIIEYLKQCGFSDLAEGTIYPLLLRLEKQGTISSKLMPSPLGPKRKYFSITRAGMTYLQEFESYWETLRRNVDMILREGGLEDATGV